MHEQQMRSFAPGVLPRFSRASLAMILAAACCGVAGAAESGTSGCSAFCSPVAPGQLDHYRAQGLAPFPGDMTLSVILWDEYRRTRAAPGDGAPAAGMSVPGGTAFVNTASTIR
jgi:hypothetical protein